MDRITDPQWHSVNNRQNVVDREFIGLFDIAIFLRLYARSIILCVSIGVFAAVFYVLTTDRVFTASTQILIEPRIPQLLQQQATEVNMSLDTAQVESQLAVMNSEKIAMMVINELKLLDDAAFNKPHSLSLGDRVKRFLSIVGIDTDRYFPETEQSSNAAPEGSGTVLTKADAEFERDRRIMQTFQRGLNVRRLGVSYAIEISFSFTDGEMAAKVANATANALVREQLETKAAAAREGGAWLEERLAELRSQMNLATQVAQEFRARHDYSVASPPEVVPGEPPVSAGARTPDIPTLEELEVTADTYRKMYESFLQAYTSSVSQQSYPVADARVITPASRPLNASHPSGKLVVTFGALAGLLAGLGLAFARHTIDSTVKSPRQLREEFGLECIGELPPPGRHPLQVVARHPHSLFSESLRRAMTGIGLSNTFHPLRIIGIASALPGDGKSSCASNLATLYATQGFTTLLIDRNRLHSASMGRPRHPGLDTDRSMEGIAERIRTASGCGFDLLHCASPASLGIHSIKEMESLLAQLPGYDKIVVDLPPLSAGAEKLAASSLFDGVIIAARWRKTPIEALGELVRVMHAVKAPIIGVLLTQVRMPSTKQSRRQARQRPC